MSEQPWTAPAVERTYPPNVAPEREALDAWLDYHRQTLLVKCAGLTAEQLCERSVPPSKLSLLGLVRHLTEVERWWLRSRIDGQDVVDIYCTDGQPRRRLRRRATGRRAGRPRARTAPRSSWPARPRPGTAWTRPSPVAAHPLDVRWTRISHDRGVRPAQRPRRPPARADRWRHRRVARGRRGSGSRSRRPAGSRWPHRVSPTPARAAGSRPGTCSASSTGSA